jgi:hypothetical protein
MATWGIIGLVIVSSAAVLLRRGMKGPRYSIETLKRAIRGLLRQGYLNGVLRIDVCRSHHPLDFRSTYLLEFRKYIHAPGAYGITLCFLKKRGPARHTDFLRLQAFCDTQHLAYAVDVQHSHPSEEMISIDCGKDSDTAHALCKTIVLNVLALPEDTVFFVLLEHGTIHDQLIDR